MTRNKAHIKKRSLTFRLAYYWGKIIGINPLTLSENNQLEFSYFSLFYGCFLSTVFIYIFCCVVLERLKLLVPGETPVAIIVDYIGIVCQFLEISLTWFVFALNQNRLNRIFKHFSRIENISRQLGIPDNSKKYLREFGNSVIFHNVMYFISLALSTSLLAQFVSTYRYLSWISFNLPRVASFNMGMLFVWSLCLVKQKLGQLNEKVRFLVKNNFAKSEDRVKEHSWGLIRNLRSNAVLLPDRIVMVSQLHRELRDLVYRIENYFVPLVLFAMGNHLAALALSTYTVNGYLRIRPKGFLGADLIIVAAYNHWIAYPIISLVVISYVCGSTSDEANKTGNILHEMLNNIGPNIPEAAKLNTFSLDLLQNHVSISLCGFFVLDQYFVYRTLSAVITYVTIMLQF